MINDNPKPVFLKEIYFDEVSGKIKIHDSNDNDYECNLYGEKLTKFLPNLTGFIGFSERKDLKQFENPVTLDKSNQIYHPQKSRFEGYFQFPNPLSTPFFNEKFSNETKKLLINKLESANRFKVKKNKHLLTLQSNSGLHYFTSSFRIVDERTKFHFIKLIDNYIQDQLNNNKYESNVVHKDPKIKALKKLKKLMLINKGDKNIFGRETTAPSKEQLKKYKSTDQSMKDFPKKKENLLDKYMDKIDKTLIKKKPHSPQISAISTFNNYQNNTLSTNTYYNTHLFNTLHSEKLTTPTTNDLNAKEKEHNFYHNTKTSFFSLALTNPRTIPSHQNNDDDLSFISEDEEVKGSGFLKTKVTSRNILDRTSLQNNLENEKMLLTGYKPPKIHEMGIKIRIFPNRLRTEGDFYKQSRQLLEKVNPKAIELEKIRNEIDRHTLEKRRNKKFLQNQKISIVDDKMYKTTK